jgi:glycosyltransferase involved in cell wall biosynthesis
MKPWRRRRAAKLRVLIIVENMPVPRDRRVWLECEALVAGGYGVSVVCPRGPGEVSREEVEGVRLYRYRPPPQPRGKFGYLYEYAYSFAMATALTFWVSVVDGFDAIQACNPPDIYFLLATPFRLMGKPFVFDHHDLSPELYMVRFGRRDGAVLRLLLLLERASMRGADHVIATNESIREIALARGGKAGDEVTVVRNGPLLEQAQDRSPRPELKEGRSFLCCWLGVMGSVDDGVDLALGAVHQIVHVWGRQDCHFAFLGSGESFDDLVRLASRLKVDQWVSFPGWVSRETAYDYLATADLGLQPDPKNFRTDRATAIKTMEYMAFEVPVVAFDVVETRRSAGEAAAYAKPNDVESFATLICELLDDPKRRAAMGSVGQTRVAEGLAWEHQRGTYVAVYDLLLCKDQRVARGSRMNAQ